MSKQGDACCQMYTEDGGFSPSLPEKVLYDTICMCLCAYSCACMGVGGCLSFLTCTASDNPIVHFQEVQQSYNSNPIFYCNQVPGHPSNLLPFLQILFVTGALMGMIIQIFYSSTILSAITVVISPIKTFDNLIQLNYHFTTHVLSMPMQDVIKVSI